MPAERIPPEGPGGGPSAAELATSVVAAEQIVQIPLDLCQPSSFNPRVFGTKPTHGLVDLAVSIRRTGQVQPATVRPLGDRYQVVAGERRWRACRLRAKGEAELVPAEAWVGDAAHAAALVAAGPPVDFLRAVVRELTEEQAMEVCVTENLEREDLHPLEEAHGVETMLQLYRGDVEAVAARLSRGVAWVAARARLTHLSAKWQKAIADEERGFQTWTAAHLVEIAKLAPPAQDELLKESFRYHVADATVADVRKAVREQLRALGVAPFDILDAALVPKVGACSTCPTTSASTPGLFADEGDEVQPPDLKKARCLNPGCWRQKQLAAAQAKVAELRREHGDAALVFGNWHDQHQLPEKQRQKARHVEGYGDFVKVKTGTKGAWPGVYFAGEKAGTVEWFTKRPQGSSGGSRKKVAGEERAVTPLAERRKALEKRRKALAVAKASEAIEKSTVVPAVAVLLALAVEFGTKHRGDSSVDYSFDGRRGDRWKAFDSRSGQGEELLRAALWRDEIRPVLLARLVYGSHLDIDKLFSGARRTGELAGVDVAALLMQAIEELPEPKSWKKLAEDERAAKKMAKGKSPAPPAAAEKKPKRAAAARGAS